MLDHDIHFPTGPAPAHLEARRFAEDIVQRLNRGSSVDLMSIINAPGQSYREKHRALVEALLEAKFEREVLAGNEYFLGENEDPTTAFERLLGSDIDIEPNISFNTKNADIIAGYKGDELKTFVFNLTKRFENMEAAATPGQLALEIVGGGMLSVGVPMAYNTYKAMKAGEALMVALRTGITKIGMKTAIVAVVVVLAALLLFLFLENPKKILGLVLNKTDKNFVVKNWNNDNKGDLFMQHGHMVDFMEDHKFADLSSEKVQIRAKIDFGDDDPESFVFAGVYFADRNVGLRGSEGVMIFTALEDDTSFAHLFAVPYSRDNGANIALVKSRPKDMEKFFRDLYDTKKVRVDKTDGGYRLVSTVNSNRGGVVASITMIDG